jgi:hypothetical protein
MIDKMVDVMVSPQVAMLLQEKAERKFAISSPA